MRAINLNNSLIYYKILYPFTFIDLQLIRPLYSISYNDITYFLLSHLSNALEEFCKYTKYKYKEYITITVVVIFLMNLISIY